MKVHAVSTLLLLCALLLPLASPAQEEQAPQVDPAAFFAAKAAAGGELDLALAVDALELLKLDIYAVQLEIERWAVEHDGNYPQHINQILIKQLPGLQPGFYANPFTAQSANGLDAIELPFGWTEDAPGNFSYIQIYDELGDVTGYNLLAYGADRASGQDVDGDGEPDGVVLWLASSAVPFPSGPTTLLSGGRPVTLDMGE